MAYLYRHIRLDTNEPFYIGIGSDDDFGRSRDKRSRNRFWKSIVAKTEYDIEIMMTDLTWDEACEKEIEFIKLYGKAHLKHGTLCNLTDGGEGTLGFKMPKSSVDRMVEKISEPIIQYNIDGSIVREWLSISDAWRALGIDTSGITKCCMGKKNRNSIGGFIWRYKDPNKWFEPSYSCNTGISESNKLQRERKKKEVIQMDLFGNIIQEWKSPTDAAKHYKITAENIYRSIKADGIAVGFKWKYKN